MTDTVRQILVALAMKLAGTPYIWGGSSPAGGFDCSGFVIWLLQVVGVLGSGDWNARTLSTMFRVISTLELKPGDLVFYGKSDDVITHVMMYAGELSGTGPVVIGASGGDHTTTSVAEAERRGARVKMKSLGYRKDFVKAVSIAHKLTA